MTDDHGQAPEADLLDEWSAVGLEPVTLPSGYQVRLRLPTPRDLIVRGLLPLQLIEDTVRASQTDGGLENIVDTDPALASRLVDGIRLLAADAIRQARKTDAEPWRPITVPPDRYSLLPEADREAIETLVQGGMVETGGSDPTAERAKRQEAAGTVDAYREFRGDGRGDGPRKGGRAIRPAPVGDDRTSDVGAGRRPRARRAPREG